MGTEENIDQPQETPTADEAVASEEAVEVAEAVEGEEPEASEGEATDGAGDAEAASEDAGDESVCDEGDETAVVETADEEAEELIELEIDEDAIYAYIVDENDNEIGFIVLNEDGEEEEYYYAEEDDASAKRASDNEFDLGISREGVAAATSDMNAIYKDGVQVAAELKSTFDEISESLSFFKKKK